MKIVAFNREPYVAAAVQEIGNLYTLPEARAAVGDITLLVSGSPRPETAMVAATALSVLATPGDPAVVDALKSLMFAQDGEVAWSAAMALARLGNASGRTILMDMLDRAFWERGGSRTWWGPADIKRHFAAADAALEPRVPILTMYDGCSPLLVE
jgi:hypothetical protein